MSNRKLQSEIDRTIKKVIEGVDSFEEIMNKFYHQASSQSQKEKYELELKREIKKLQRLRDQIKGWSALNEIKDKTTLAEHRRLIEVQMERFKVVEKEMKTKAYSREGLTLATKSDPKDKERMEIINWISVCIDRLTTQTDTLEAESEMLSSSPSANAATNFNSKRLSTISAEKQDLLSKHISKHRWHIEQLEIILRMIQNESLSLDQVARIKDDVEYYVEENQEIDFVENEQIYEELGLSSNTDDEHQLLNENISYQSEEDESKHVGEFHGENNEQRNELNYDTLTEEERPSNFHKNNETYECDEVSEKIEKGGLFINGDECSKNIRSSLPKGSDTVASLNLTKGSTTIIPSITAKQPSSLLKITPQAGITATAKAPSYSSANINAGNSSHIPKPANVSTKTPSASTYSNPGLPMAAILSKYASTTGITTTAPVGTAIDAHQQPIVPSPVTSSPWTTQKIAETLLRGATKQQQPAAISSSNSTGVVVPSNMGQAALSGNLSNPTSIEESSAASLSLSLQLQLQLQQQPIKKDENLLAGMERIGVDDSTSSKNAQQHQHHSHTLYSFGKLKNLLRERRISSQLTNTPATGGLCKSVESAYSNIPDICEHERNKPYTPLHPNPSHPSYYPANPPSVFENGALYGKFDVDTLFFIFYYLPKTPQQYLAARELKRQSWRFHKKYLTWFQRFEEPKVVNDDFEQGTYIYFDYEGSWCQRKKKRIYL